MASNRLYIKFVHLRMLKNVLTQKQKNNSLFLKNRKNCLKQKKEEKKRIILLFRKQ